MIYEPAVKSPALVTPPVLDTRSPHIARIYDYWLGGKDNYAADRDAAEAMVDAYPDLMSSARANRAFGARAVRYLTAVAGVRQFLDIGAGIPAPNNVHEVAQAVAPECRVVYVDNDPMVLAHGRALMTSDPRGVIGHVDADVRNPAALLADAAGTLDFSQPIAVLMLAVLHMVEEEERPGELVAQVMAAVPTGSYLALTHPAADIEPEMRAEAARRYRELAHDVVTYRTRDQVECFFTGLQLVEPGLVRGQLWRPACDAEAVARAAFWGGIGRKG